MERGEYSLFVTAGNVKWKLKHIMHNRYLTHSYENLCEAEGSLVTSGFSFGKYDEHIMEVINIAATHGRKIADKLWSVYTELKARSDLAGCGKTLRSFFENLRTNGAIVEFAELFRSC